MFVYLSIYLFISLFIYVCVYTCARMVVQNIPTDFVAFYSNILLWSSFALLVGAERIPHLFSALQISGP